VSDHVIAPRRTGRRATCWTVLEDGEICGRAVIRYRATRLIRKPHWRHATWQQDYIGQRSRDRAELG
jgi:hypothetical protein